MGILSRMGRAATALSKYYYPFTWRNKPSIESPINEVHLNHIEDGISEMDAITTSFRSGLSRPGAEPARTAHGLSIR